MSIADLAAELAAQGLDWCEAEARMRAMISALLLAAGQGPVAAACAALAPACGGGAFPRARALYGVDVMFDAALNPKLLEARRRGNCTCGRELATHGLVLTGFSAHACARAAGDVLSGGGAADGERPAVFRQALRLLVPGRKHGV